jgi:hypothetical protein
MKPTTIALIVFAAFAYYELVYTATPASIPNNPANANALGIPTAPINPNTLTPAQLGTGLFENASGLGSQQPNVVPGA